MKHIPHRAEIIDDTTTNVLKSIPLLFDKNGTGVWAQINDWKKIIRITIAQILPIKRYTYFMSCIFNSKNWPVMKPLFLLFFSIFNNQISYWSSKKDARKWTWYNSENHNKCEVFEISNTYKVHCKYYQ